MLATTTQKRLEIPSKVYWLVAFGISLEAQSGNGDGLEEV